MSLKHFKTFQPKLGKGNDKIYTNKKDSFSFFTSFFYCRKILTRVQEIHQCIKDLQGLDVLDQIYLNIFMISRIFFREQKCCDGYINLAHT